MDDPVLGNVHAKQGRCRLNPGWIFTERNFKMIFKPKDAIRKGDHGVDDISAHRASDTAQLHSLAHF